jgi:hypothetical protein
MFLFIIAIIFKNEYTDVEVVVPNVRLEKMIVRLTEHI